MPRKSKGRQKIEMTKMSKESNLLVTFSKRRSGLFKKASELCTLCGAEIAIIVFSPGKKVFSFGHPCVESIVDRFLTRNPAPSVGNLSNTMQLVEAHRSASVRELNMQFTELGNELDEQKKRGEELSNMRKESEGKCWWECPVEGLGLEEVEHLRTAMVELKKNVVMQVEKLKAQVAVNEHFWGGSTSGGTGGGEDDGDGGSGGGEAKGPAFGLSMTTHGYTLGCGRGGFY